MQVLNILLSVILVTSVVACDQLAVSTSSGSGVSSASSSSSSDKKEITMSGTNGKAELAGDKIEIKESTVFVNGVSFGAVPTGAEVKYTMNAEGRTLFVGGERRNVSK